MSYICIEQTNPVIHKCSTAVTGGPKAERGPPQRGKLAIDRKPVLRGRLHSWNIQLMKQLLRRRWSQTFTYHQKMFHDPVRSSEIFTVFPRVIETYQEWYEHPQLPCLETVGTLEVPINTEVLKVKWAKHHGNMYCAGLVVWLKVECEMPVFHKIHHIVVKDEMLLLVTVVLQTMSWRAF